MKRQDGYLTRKSGAWLGHYSKWILDHKTGQRKRLQRAFKIGPTSSITRTRAKEKLRERIVQEVGITADSRVTVGWFIDIAGNRCMKGNGETAQHRRTRNMSMPWRKIINWPHRRN
jgi:hypothetical protein